jgi:hypothetical protein
MEQNSEDILTAATEQRLGFPLDPLRTVNEYPSFPGAWMSKEGIFDLLGLGARILFKCRSDSLIPLERRSNFKLKVGKGS